MKYQIIIRGFLSLCFGLLYYTLPSQTVDQYKRQRELLDAHIQMLDKNLTRMRSEKASVAEEFLLLERKMASRERLLGGIGTELSHIDSTIASISASRSGFSEVLEKKRSQLSKTLRLTYYHKLSQNSWLNLLSSSTFKDAYLKWMYYRQLKDFLQSNMADIEAYQSSLTDTLAYLNVLKSNQANIALEASGQQGALERERKEQRRLLERLEANERLIREELGRQKREEDRLNALIGDIIRDENRRIEASLESLDNRDLSVNFETNRGRMIWPIRNGVITNSFGRKRHPSLPDVFVENLGIDMAAKPGQEVYAVHEGTVLITTYQIPYKHIVIVNHGDWTTAYYYLDVAEVQKGSKVDTGQKIGRLGADQDAIFHFQIWHNQQQVDPQAWLGPQ